jgi:hypothetical protein
VDEHQSSAPAHPVEKAAACEHKEAPADAGNTPEARTTGRLATVVITDSNDNSAPAHPSTEENLAKLEERLRHEIMDDEERQELRDRVLRLRRRHSQRS